MMVGKGALFAFLWTIQASTAFVARPRSTAAVELSSSRENYGWDASRYERYAPPQSYGDSYYNQPPPPPQQYYSDNYVPMENNYNYDNNYNPNNDYYYNSQPPPPPPQDYYQDTYNNNVYQDRGNSYDDRNLNNDVPNNAPLAPYQGYRNDQPEYYDNDPRRRNEMLPRRQYRSSFDLFDELWEDTNRLFDMMSPFRGTGSLLGMESPFFSSSSLLSPFFDSSFFGSSVSEMRSLLSSQQESIQPLLEQAEQYLNQDEACIGALGTDIRMGPVVSQSSASSSFNGEPTQSLTRLQVMVQGSLAEGSLWVSADAQGIAELILRTNNNGEEIPVQIPRGSRSPMPPPRMPRRRRSQQRGEDPRDVIVDAEVVSEDENNNRANESPRVLPSAEARAFPNDWTKTI